MCGRYTLRHSTQQVVMRFAVNEVVHATFAEMGPDAPRFNIAPTQPIAVVTENSPRTLELMRWGLVPSWAKDPAIGSRMLNARAETLTEKPSFRTALTRRRCLIPADGCYEWKPQGKTKQPFCIHRKVTGCFWRSVHHFHSEADPFRVRLASDPVYVSAPTDRVQKQTP